MIKQLDLDSADPSFTLVATLSKREFIFAFRWNERAQIWTLDVTAADSTPIVVGRRVKPGVSMLAGATSEQRPPGTLYFWTVDNTDPLPIGRDDLGSVVGCYYDDGI